ncbi:MAG: transposase, partial [bacterium]|nr:transposase [bacterium]
IHSDRGPSMKSHAVAQLLATLGVTKSHSRPHVSNDNPFSESQFKTLKYRPEFPERFGSQEDGRGFCGRFFQWYNHEHYHSGIGLLTPASVHHGRASKILAARQGVLHAAYVAHPERFVNKQPTPLKLPEAVWINPPPTSPEDHEKGLPKTAGSQKPDAPSAHPRSGYPSPGCVPAEPGSVSPDTVMIPDTLSLSHPPSDTRVMPQKIPGAWGLAPTFKENCSRSEATLH